jgi:hypothetical protein
MSTVALLSIALAVSSAAFAALYFAARRIDNYGIVTSHGRMPSGFSRCSTLWLRTAGQYGARSLPGWR